MRRPPPTPGCRQAEPFPVGTWPRPGAGVLLLFLFSALSASPRFSFSWKILRSQGSPAPGRPLQPSLPIRQAPEIHGKPRTREAGPFLRKEPAGEWVRKTKRKKPRRRGERGEEKSRAPSENRGRRRVGTFWVLAASAGGQDSSFLLRVSASPRFQSSSSEILVSQDSQARERLLRPAKRIPEVPCFILFSGLGQ